MFMGLLLLVLGWHPHVSAAALPPPAPAMSQPTGSAI